MRAIASSTPVMMPDTDAFSVMAEIMRHFGVPRGISGTRAAYPDQFQHVLGGTNDDRHLQRQRHDAGPAGEVFHLRRHDGVNEQAHHDRRCGQRMSLIKRITSASQDLQPYSAR